MTGRKKHVGFWPEFRSSFFRGLAILLPSIVTLWILWQAFAFLFNNVASPINRGIRLGVLSSVAIMPEQRRPGWYLVSDDQIAERRRSRAAEGLRDLPDDRLRTEIQRKNLAQWWSAHWYLEATGLIVAVSLIYLAGRFLSGLIGRRVYTRFEGLFSRIPGFRHVYPHVKQVVDMVMGEKRMAFNRAVLVEYPRTGIWTVGLVTGSSLRQIGQAAGQDVLSIFIPSTPTPFTGFTITVPKAETIDLDIPIDEIVRFVITAGVLAPGDRSGPSDPPVGLPRAPADARPEQPA